ncbi:T-complex protein 1 subunit epsilon (CCT5) [Vairimorpha necatrix]|uniref:T-complex protein 1 subunit epsilon n=1 Tax=Vairimorpha necatrix TaxID=6039 RepID=A0AAX4J9I7_9MICR
MSQLLTDEIGQAFEITDDSNIRVQGKNTIYTNISIVNNITNFISSSFGPCGMDKILQSKDDEITVTNDGATILREMDMTDNDIAQLFVQLSEAQDNEIGDGTTGVLILANAMLQNSKQLMEKGIHPIRIAETYDNMLNKAIDHLTQISEPIKNKKEAMLNAAKTSLYSKVVSKAHNKFAEICVEAILSVADVERKDVDFSLINYEKKFANDVSETELIKGMAIKKEFSHPQMKKEYKNAKIALLACPFEPPKLKNKHSLLIKNPEEFKALQNYEKETFLDMIKSLKDAKVDLVMCQWGFDDEANSLLMENNLPAIRWVGGNDLDLIAVHVNGNIISRFEDLKYEDLGQADVMEISDGTENEKLIIIQNNKQKKAVTIIVKGGNDMIIEEAKRSLQDGLCAVRNVLINDRLVYGGGASEISTSIFIEQESAKYSGEEQECIIAFSRALEQVPLLLAQNSNFDSLKTLTELRKRQIESKNPFLGVDCLELNENNMKTLNIFDTLSSKISQLQSAVQFVSTILKINDVIVNSNK